MSKHALLSPSSSERWINCTPSAMLESESGAENKTSFAAQEGTIAHEICENKLRKALNREFNQSLLEEDNKEMEKHTDAYVEFVMKQIAIAKQTVNVPLVLVESRIDYSEYAPDGYGTADCLIFSDSELHVIDFKYGIGLWVDAYENSQLKCYALGALEVYGNLYDIKKVSMSIFQPRLENVSTWTISIEELMNWAEDVLKPSAEKAIKGEGKCNVGEWCTFCRVGALCRARAEEKMKLAYEEFKLPPLLTDKEIEEVLSVIPDLTKWAKTVKAYAKDSAINHGKTFSGFKVVEGRPIRRYKDEIAVAETATANGYTDIYHHNLISLTDMQKMIGKDKFEEILGDLVIKIPGRLTLVANTDKREAVNVENIKNEFNDNSII